MLYNVIFSMIRTLEDPDYSPLCDVDEGISCSVAFNSSYGKGFGFVDKIVGRDIVAANT